MKLLYLHLPSPVDRVMLSSATRLRGALGPPMQWLARSVGAPTAARRCMVLCPAGCFSD